MTPSANVELVRSIFAAYERGDPLSPLELADPDMQLVTVGGPEPASFKGLSEIEAGWRDYMSAWEEFSVEAEEYRELDHERVLVPARFHGRGKTSGTEVVRARGCHLFHIRSGRVTRQVFYWDREQAFADLGLGPEGDASEPGSQ